MYPAQFWWVILDIFLKWAQLEKILISGFKIARIIIENCRVKMSAALSDLYHRIIHSVSVSIRKFLFGWHPDKIIGNNAIIWHFLAIFRQQCVKRARHYFLKMTRTQALAMHSAWGWGITSAIFVSPNSCTRPVTQSKLSLIETQLKQNWDKSEIEGVKQARYWVELR